MADDIGTIIAGTLDFYAAVDTLAGNPVKKKLFAVVLVKLVQADVTWHGIIYALKSATIVAASGAANNLSRNVRSEKRWASSDSI